MGKVLFGHVYRLMNAIPAPLPVAGPDAEDSAVRPAGLLRHGGAGAADLVVPGSVGRDGAVRAGLLCPAGRLRRQ